MGIINKFFNKGNESKMDQLTATQGELNNKVHEINTKIGQVSKALELAQTDHMLDGTASSKKQVEKYEKHLDKFNTELASTQEELGKVSQEITTITADELQAELVSAAKQDAEAREFIDKHRKVEQLFRAKLDRIDGFSIGMYTPNLDNLARSRGELVKEHARDSGRLSVDYLNALGEEQAKVNAKVDKDFEEFKKAFDKYFGEGN